jgi:hypothetical protein
MALQLALYLAPTIGTAQHSGTPMPSQYGGGAIIGLHKGNAGVLFGHTPIMVADTQG